MGSSDIPAERRIAVIGMAGRFPGAESIDELWNNLSGGVESIQRFSRQEMLAEGVSAELIDDPDYVAAGGALAHSDLFAADFFGYSPRDARIMDPQQRLFLECSWEALESAGYGQPAKHNPIGVFAAVSLNTYLLNRLVHRPDLLEGLVDVETTIANDKDFLATRVAYKLDLRGPTVVVQSACSSSLLALHLARQAILTGDCDIALAGGTSVDVPQRAGYLHKPDGIYSSDGHCRPFDAKADGMVGGSGVGVVVLKRLDRALSDRDTVFAVVRGSAVNNDGANKVGYSAPSVEAQAAVVSAAHDAARVESSSIGYVEAHGTATALGDPIEVEALAEAFGELEPRSCVLGAVKSNLGHLNAAAGITGLIKAALVLRHGLIPPTLHFETPNPHIDLARTPFWINTEAIEWASGATPRRAGVSSFGMGGTNVHVVLEEAPVQEVAQEEAVEAGPAPERRHSHRILPISARTESSLREARHRLGDHLERHPELALRDVAHTLQVGRQRFPHRLAVVAKSHGDAIGALRGEPSSPGGVAPANAPAKPPGVCFLFPGQGAQYPGMVAALAEELPVVADVVSDGCRRLGGSLGRELSKLLLDPSGNGAAAERLAETELAQPALFLVEYALARFLIELGVAPSGMIGHSIGEYTAACLAGVFSFSEGVELVRERGRSMQSMPPGIMLAVALPESEIRSRLEGELVVAAVNEPQTSVVSGAPGDVEALEARLAAEEIAFRRLKTSHAFHSPRMREAAEPLGEAFERLALSAPRLPFVSNVSGDWITADDAADPAYWRRHLLEPVRFSRGLARLLESGASVLVEIGPGTTLTDLASRHPGRSPEQRVLSTMAHPKSRRRDARPLFEAVASLWSVGLEIDWTALDRGDPGSRVPLPTYPFERQSFWVGPISQPEAQAPIDGSRRDQDDWCYLPSWQRTGPAPTVETDRDVPLVLLRPESEEAEAVARELASTRPLVEVLPGSTFETRGSSRFRLDPRSADQYEELLANLQTRRLCVLHLWGLPDDEGADDRRRGIDSLLALSQGLHPGLESLDLVCVSATSQEVTGREAIDPWQALVLGAGRVLPFERDGWRVRIVDLERADDGGLGEATAARLIDELACADEEPLIAYRGRHRWKPIHTPIELPPIEEAGGLIRRGAVCLVAGGFGGVGRTLAEALYDRFEARLALVGRRQLPARDDWDELLSSGTAQESVVAAIETVRHLEARGAEVEVASADVSDRSALAAAIEAVRERLGPIELAVHAAGVAGGRALDLQSLEHVDRALAAKVTGTQNLFGLLCRDASVPLVLCASLAGEIGGFGQFDYCAANAFMDAFAASRSRDEHVLAIDWETWSESGMAVETEVPQELEPARREALRFGLADEEGKQLFLRLLGYPEPRVLISTRSIGARLAADRRSPAMSVGSDPPPLSGTAAGRSDLSTPWVEPRTEVERRLAEVWSRLFGIEPIGVEDDFFELGGHSLLATQMLNRLRKIYPDAPLRLATLFDAPTIAQLAAVIEAGGGTGESRRLPDRRQLAALSAEERTSRLRDYLETRLAEHGAFDPDDIDGRALAAGLVWDLRRDLDLVVYPHELEGVTTLDGMATTIAAAVQGIPAPRTSQHLAAESQERSRLEPPAEKNPAMIFLLSAPRSGSTLLRLMLAGHSRLFCPPELTLLSASSLEQWKRQQHGIFARDGVTRALMELERLEPEEALAEIDRLVEDDLPVERLYARLQDACGDRLLVDKSPAYALDVETLERAEQLFELPRYLLLSRHPVAVIESLVRHRMEALLADGPVDDAWRFAESVWRVANSNLVRLAERVGDRALAIRFEELVTSPATVARRIARFLELDFEPGLLEPYAGGRMIDGPGDPDIFQHDRIESELAEAWRQIELPFELDAETVELAERLGYEISSAHLPESPTDREDDGLAAAEAAGLLSRLDELSDEEVEATLASLLEDQGGEDEGVGT